MMKVKVTVGCNYPPADTRAEPGEVIEVEDKIGKALVAAGAGEPYHEPKTTKLTPNTSKSALQAEKGTEG